MPSVAQGYIPARGAERELHSKRAAENRAAWISLAAEIRSGKHRPKTSSHWESIAIGFTEIDPQLTAKAKEYANKLKTKRGAR